MSRVPFAFVLALLVVVLVAIGATSAQQRVSEADTAPVRYRGLTAPHGEWECR